MSDERPDTGTPGHHPYPARDDDGSGFCQEQDCKPETACLEDDCCKDDDNCHAEDQCAEDHSQASHGGVTARVDDNASVNSKASTCCGGSVERCDEKCIYTAAKIECAKACEGDDEEHKKHPHDHDAAGDHPDSACSSHLSAAFEKYASYIEQAKCICRSMVSNGLAPSACCKPAAAPENSTVTAAASSWSAFATSSSARGKETSSQQHGMSTGYLRPHHHHHRRGRHHHHQQGVSDGAVRRRNPKKRTSHDDGMSIHLIGSDSHDHDHDHDHGRNPGKGSCCTGHSPKSSAVVQDSHDHGKGSCCTGHPPKGSAIVEAGFVQNENFDIEKSADYDLVSVAISGMDCTSCGDKLSRVLLMTPGVTQARVNFIAGRADFTINSKVTSAEEATHLAMTGSGFRLTRIVGGDYFLDIAGNSDVAKELTREPPNGVTDVFVIDKKTIRLAYDPAHVGARTIFDSISDKTSTLAPPCADPQLESCRRRLWDQAIKTALSAVCTIPVVVLSWGQDLADKNTKAIVSVVLGTAVQAVAVPEFYRPALSTLFYSRAIEMDMLVVISITAAYLYSIVAFGFQMAGKPLGTSEFFETSTLLITLILVGRLIATFARYKAISAVSVRSIQPTIAVLANSKEGKDQEIDARLLQYGDQFRVLPHSRVPTDGKIIEGVTEIDESMLTGEAMPVLKKVNDPVVAGTINGDGTILVQLERLPGKNTVTDIAQLVDEAANTKPRIQDLADKVASWFVPAVSSVAIAVLVIWIVVGLKVMDYSTSKAALEAITYFVATLAVACPCALGLAVPMVLVVAGGIAARNGVIIKSAETTERARKATDIIFDKTGTITENDLLVTEEKYFDDGNKGFATGLAKALVAGGKHPVSAAVAKHLAIFTGEDNVEADVTDIHVVPGAGIEAKLGEKGRILRAGHPRWTKTEANPVVDSLQKDGLTTLVVTLDDTPLVVFGLRTRIRPEASRIISDLKARNINVHLVSGDQRTAVKAVAAAVGIPEENFAAEYTPSQKRDYVAALMEDSSRYVVFCGDGTNDAVAVAQANVGIQIGGGSATSSDVTQTAADAILLNGLEGIPFLIKMSGAAFNRMAFNFIWSAIYNVLAITMASGAWVKFRIPPAYAGLGEFISVLPVIAASMTMFLLNLKPNRNAEMRRLD